MLLANQDRTSNQGLQENLHMEAILNKILHVYAVQTVMLVTSITRPNELKKNKIYIERVLVVVLSESQSNLAHSQAVKHPALLLTQ